MVDNISECGCRLHSEGKELNKIRQVDTKLDSSCLQTLTVK